MEAVSDLAELIALSAYLRAEGIAGDGALWAATASTLGLGELEEGRSRLRLDNDPSPLERLARTRAGVPGRQWRSVRSAQARKAGRPQAAALA